MTISEALRIIRDDEDYLDICKWKRKHFKAIDIYFKMYGFDWKYRRKLKKNIRFAIKYIKVYGHSPYHFSLPAGGGERKDERSVSEPRSD